MCLARTRTYKTFRDESFHLTGLAGKNTSTTNLAILMQQRNSIRPCRETLSLSLSLSLSQTSLANTCRTRAFVEFAHAKSDSATSWKHDALPIGQCQCQTSQLSNLQMPIDDCKCDLDIAVQALKNGCDSTNSQKHCHHDATTFLSRPKLDCEVRGPVSFGC